ncbi:hypothetical protein B0H14DRAFT_2703384, partial [Mycena olivaceomarginata]
VPAWSLRPGHTSAVIDLVLFLKFLTAIILLLIYCGIQRRRIRQAARPYPAGGSGGQGHARPSSLPLSSSARFPHRMQYGRYNGSSGTSPYAPPPGPAPPGSDYPPTAVADWAAPPYVKEVDGEAAKYLLPPGPPPPGFDATYAPVRLSYSSYSLSPTPSQLTHL